MNPVKLLLTLLIVSLLGCGWLGYSLYQQNIDHKAAIERLTLDHARELEARDSLRERLLAEQTERHEQRVQAMTQDFEAKLDTLRGDQRKQMAEAFKEFESIFEGNRQTIEYINLLESKVRGGQQLGKNEVEKLTVIATALGFLQKQYQKPLQEFSELEAYFERQANRPSAAATAAPKKSFAFFRRTFSKTYRENEKQFYREEGERQAFEKAQQEFSRVYSSAQQAMRAVDLNTNEQIQKLHALIEEKDAANQQDLSEFFTKARQALRTHQDVLQFEPEVKLPPAPPAP